MSRKSLLSTAIFLLIGLCLSIKADALVSPVGVSFLPPFEIPLRNNSIVGFRFNLLMGVHEAVQGFDLGTIGNLTDRAFGGIQLAGVFNRNKGPTTIAGTQLSGLVNWNLNKSEIYGIQATGGININHGKSRLVGLGVGVLGNVATQGTIAGAQIGIFNRANQVFGFQVGVINYADSLHGIQLGLININKTGPLPFFPVLNLGI